MQKFLLTNAAIFQRFESIENKLIRHDRKFEQLFNALENKSELGKQGIFYDGQIYDAYVFVSKLIKSARRSILLTDDYIDESVLALFTKRNENVTLSIYTKTISKQLLLDVKKHNEQCPPVKIKEFNKAHDRFMVIDGTHLYHFGASLTDLGKKWFAFSKMDIDVVGFMGELKGINDGNVRKGAI